MGNFDARADDTWNWAQRTAMASGFYQTHEEIPWLVYWLCPSCRCAVQTPMVRCAECVRLSGGVSGVSEANTPRQAAKR